MADATITTVIDVTIGGRRYLFDSVKTLADTLYAVKRRQSVTTTATALLEVDATPNGTGEFKSIDAALIINEDTTNPLVFSQAATQRIRSYIPAGGHAIVMNKKMETGAFSAFEDVADISAGASTGTAFVTVVGLSTTA